MELKKVVLFHREIIAFGGAERLLFEEHKYFKKRGVESKILTFKIREQVFQEHWKEIINDIEVVKGKKLLRQIYMLRKRLLSIKPDIVLTAYGWVDIFLATLFTKIPYVVHMHGTAFWVPGNLLKYGLVYHKVFDEIRGTLRGHKEFIPPYPNCGFKKRLLLEVGAIIDYLAVRKALEIIVLTERIRWEVKKLYGRDSVIARGCLDPFIFGYIPKEDIRRRLNLNLNQKIILSVSRLDPRKRIDVLIKAFARLDKKLDNVVLVIVGTGPDEIRLRSLANQLTCSDRIIFTGFVSDHELLDYYNACDVFAVPGWTTSPITAYEALALRKKVVWSSEASEPEQILSDPGVFLAEPEPESFANALYKALNSHEKPKVDLSRYTWDNYFQTVYTAIKRHLNDG